MKISNICRCIWIITKFILTNELPISALLSHKDNPAICGKSSWYRLLRLFEYYFITIMIIAFTIFLYPPQTILEYFFLCLSILSLSVTSTENPCRLCNLEVKTDDGSIQCDLRDRWNHINCVNVSKQKHEKLKNDPSPEYCTFCTNEMHFSKMSSNDLKNLHATRPTQEFHLSVTGHLEI